MKQRLYTPGPTPIPPDVTLAMASPLIYHRSPEFRTMFARVQQNLQYVHQTAQPVLPLASSGTGAMEATFVSLFSQGDAIISINGGKFGERWVTLPRMFGLSVVEVAVPWGEVCSEERLTQALRSHPEAKAVYLTHCETSSGTMTDIQRLAAVIREHSTALVCVDGVSSVGGLELRFDDWGIDVCASASQKGYMVPPGLGFVAVSERAVRAMEQSTLPKFYFDLRKALSALRTNDTPWTPAISLLVGLDRSLVRMREEGMEAIWQRHRILGRAVRAGVQALGLRLFSRAPSDTVTAVWLPEGVVWAELNGLLKEEYGITCSGGQGPYAGKIVRMAHLGFADRSDILALLAALGDVLHRCGWRCRVEAGVEAAVRELD